MDKQKIADILRQIGVLLELKGENPFKTRAYENAARALETASEPIEKLIQENRLEHIKGIGESIRSKIMELATTGRLPYYEELKASIPAGLVEMLQIPGLGPKKVKAIYEKLGITTIDELEKACKEGKIAVMDGFGERTQSKILEGIAFRRQYSSKHLLDDAITAAEPILNALHEHPDVIQCSVAGSLRRYKELIGDIDFLVSSKKPLPVIDFFTQQPGIISVSAKGETKASVILNGGIQADLRVVSNDEYPFALAYFTGSKEHNIVMRQRAIQRGLRLNEYGLFKSDVETRDPKLRIPCKTEEEIFAELGLSYIPPELREDQGEFDAAEKNQIPRLIEWTELKGSLHNHSNYSDGQGTLEEIARKMDEYGFQYWAITDHSKSSYIAGGINEETLHKQVNEIRKINKKLKEEGLDIQLLTGIEVDILANGELDFSDSILAELDVVIASIHQGFSGDEAETTKRLIKAAQNKYVHIIGHLSGRLLLEREPYKVNHIAVIDACAETGTWIELNCHPMRFDMDWRYWRYARDKGVKCVINCDAHRFEHANYLRLGVGIARKGWLRKEDVINTLPLNALLVELNKKRSC